MRSRYINPEDTATGRQLKRYLTDLAFDKRLKTNEIAARLNISEERAYKYFNESTPNHLPAYLLPLWAKVIGPELLDHLNFRAGRISTDIPPESVDDKALVKAAAHATKECGEALLEFSQAIDDDDISFREAKGIKKEALEAMSALAGLVALAERNMNREDGK
ncbi:MAG: phage regulatory CII family protein [Desulfatiglandales bacterium]